MFWLVCIATFLFCLYLLTRRKSDTNEPPAFDGVLTIIGHLRNLFGDGVSLWHTIIDLINESLKAGGIIKLRFGYKTVYVVTNPEDCMTLSNVCLHKDELYDIGKPWLGEGLVTAKLDIWKVHRKLLNPAFNQQVLDGYINIFNHQSRKFVSDLNCKVGQGIFDHSNDCHKSALETIFLTAFGTNNEFFNDEYIHVVTKLFAILSKRFQNVLLHNNFIYSISPLKREQDKCLKFIEKITNKILKTRKANYIKKRETKISNESEATEVKFKPFMDLLLELAYEKGAFTDQEIKDESYTMMAAGQDTVANTLIFTIVVIGSYPDVQEKIYAELLRVFGTEDRDVTKNDLSQLVYLEAVIKESLRIYPVVPMVGRVLNNDVKLSQYTLRAGSTCALFSYGMHRHASWGPDAEQFKPDRWLNMTSSSDNVKVFAAFSLGRRSCLGKTFAMMSLKITLAHLLRNYRIKGDHTKMILQINVTLQPHSGHFIEIEEREK